MWKSLLTISPMPEYCNTDFCCCCCWDGPCVLQPWEESRHCPLSQLTAQRCPGHCSLSGWGTHLPHGFWQCRRAWQQPGKREKPSRGPATTCPTDRGLRDLWKNFVPRSENKYESVSISCRGVTLNIGSHQKLKHSLFLQFVWGFLIRFFPSLSSFWNKRAHLAVDSTAFSRSALEDFLVNLDSQGLGKFLVHGQKTRLARNLEFSALLRIWKTFGMTAYFH